MGTLSVWKRSRTASILTSTTSPPSPWMLVIGGTLTEGAGAARSVRPVPVLQSRLREAQGSLRGRVLHPLLRRSPGRARQRRQDPQQYGTARGAGAPSCADRAAGAGRV